MNRITLCAASIALVISGLSVASPVTPDIDVGGSNNLKYSKIELSMGGPAGYNQMVQYNEQIPITIAFSQAAGQTGDTYKIYFDGNQVATGPISSSQTVAVFNYAQGGRYQVSVEACDSSGCSESATRELVIEDTDGAHLAPLSLNVDPNNQSYDTDPDTVVGSYFVEWGIYGRDFTVDKLPADNLSHVLYGFIPICGPNGSLMAANSNSYSALMAACQGVNDYEVVVHDPWAAYQKLFSQAGQNASSEIKGNYGMLMALKQRNPDLKIIPSIGGWTLSDPFFDFTTKANRDTFVASVKRFLKTWKFYDGVDIDWEFPGGGGASETLGDPDNDGDAYVALVQELRAMLDQLEAETGRTYELTSAIGVGYDKLEDVNYADAAQYLDYIFAMSYDFYGAWNNILGHQTALSCGSFMRPGECDGSGVDENGEAYQGPAYTAENGIQLLLAQGVPANKLVLGAAMYGRGWEGVTPDTLSNPNDPMTGVGSGPLTGTTAQGVWEPGVIDYKGIKTFMLGADNTGINGFQYGYDEQAEAPWVWNPTSGQLVTFDDPRSVQAKGQYVRELGLAGLFSWEIDADNGDILNAMHEGLAADDNLVEENQAPIADAGLDATVTGPATITLDGSGSSDSDGSITDYNWTQISGTPASLNGSGSATPSVTLDAVTQTETLTFQLSVTDDQGEVGVDTVSITVNPPPAQNQAPVVELTAPDRAWFSQRVVINLSAHDPDGDQLSYQWQIPSNLGVSVSMTNESATFTAPLAIIDKEVTFSVTVSDGEVSTTDSVTMTIKSPYPPMFQSWLVYIYGLFGIPY
ncbi:glycosyl hydrolase family 18 protein [Vibrio brasiliensis]|uniref:glycosyl hydrolase family 18 protein n=1 Tax=Vibrio brasiliensis TaxID=170652 RepID=UPI001EFE47C6|nr:glycosyl hydrolase family 18 protein [Vibrio brasiliensis]MCG9647768.1 glycosyl hydrolase family 18 protein [Vibrio brasiliensis]